MRLLRQKRIRRFRPLREAEVDADHGARLRCKIRSYLRPNFSANFTDFRQLERAVSRLYRSRFLQPNTHFAAFFEIYKNIIPSHRSKFKKFANFRREVFAIFKILFKNLLLFTVFVDFCTDFDENFSEFRQITQRPLRILQISGFLVNSEHIFDDSDRISTEFRWQ